MTDDMLIVFGGGFILLTMPAYTYFSLRFGFSGLLQATTVTEFGPRTGLLARLWGLLYLLAFACYAPLAGYVALKLFELGLNQILTILLRPFSMAGEVAVMFIGIGLLLMGMGLVLVKFVARLKGSQARHDEQARQSYLYLYGFVCVVIGIFSLIQFSLWAYITVLVLSVYASLPLWLKFHAAA